MKAEDVIVHIAHKPSIGGIYGVRDLLRIGIDEIFFHPEYRTKVTVLQKSDYEQLEGKEYSEERAKKLALQLIEGYFVFSKRLTYQEAILDKLVVESVETEEKPKNRRKNGGGRKPDLKVHQKIIKLSSEGNLTQKDISKVCGVCIDTVGTVIRKHRKEQKLIEKE